LQLAVLNEYAARFVDDVLRPAVSEPRGLPRLRALLENWLRLLAREIEQGCLLIAGASEYDDRPGPLHDAMVRIVTAWKKELLRAIEQSRAEGHLEPRVDADQLVFEIYGLMLVTHQDARLLRSKDSPKRARSALTRLLDSFGTAAGRRSLARADRASKSGRGARSGRAAVSPAESKRAPDRSRTVSTEKSPRVHVRRAASRTRGHRS